jgi:3-methyladenine DNA glycosylase Mpg
MAAVGLGRDFYARAAIDCAPSFLGKVLVRETPDGRVAGIISEVELITKRQYGFDLCDGRGLFLEDRGIAVPEQAIRRSVRAGINPKLRGHDAPLRFRVDPRPLA